MIAVGSRIGARIFAGRPLRDRAAVPHHAFVLIVWSVVALLR